MRRVGCRRNSPRLLTTTETEARARQDSRRRRQCPQHRKSTRRWIRPRQSSWRRTRPKNPLQYRWRRSRRRGSRARSWNLHMGRRCFQWISGQRVAASVQQLRQSRAPHATPRPQAVRHGHRRNRLCLGCRPRRMAAPNGHPFRVTGSCMSKWQVGREWTCSGHHRRTKCPYARCNSFSARLGGTSSLAAASTASRWRVASPHKAPQVLRRKVVPHSSLPTTFRLSASREVAISFVSRRRSVRTSLRCAPCKAWGVRAYATRRARPSRARMNRRVAITAMLVAVTPPALTLRRDRPQAAPQLQCRLRWSADRLHLRPSTSS
mmetsp:Transcript_101692/g.286695  ORF Transcript_101692/g.286695 Transcript_101692/m.286695 type:complete len:321 (-) Transcript_101692:777-1739(-)